MNELSRHIEILLLDNDCVIVPGFGGFVAHYMVAEYDENVERFCPPMRTLGFNRQLQLNDSLLIQAYVEAYDISYPEALRRVEAEVAEVYAQIESEGYYEFSGVGVVSKLSDGRFTFEPCMAGVVTPALYGLSSYIMPSAQVEEKEDEMQPVAVMGNVEDESNTSLPVVEKEPEDSVVEEEFEEYDEEEESGLFISYRKMWYAAAAAVILLLLPLAYNSLTVGRGSQNNAVIKSSVGDTGIEVASKIGEGIDKIMDSKNDTPNKVESNEAVGGENKESVREENKAKEETSKKYSIILASRVSQKGANEFVSSLERAGLNEATICEVGAMRRVMYGNYSTESEAEKALRQLKKKDRRFEGTWVQKID